MGSQSKATQRTLSPRLRLVALPTTILAAAALTKKTIWPQLVLQLNLLRSSVGGAQKVQDTSPRLSLPTVCSCISYMLHQREKPCMLGLRTAFVILQKPVTILNK